VSQPLRVVVADDSFLVRDGTARLLSAGNDVLVVAAVSDAPSLLGAVDEHCPDVVLTDVRMPHGIEGIEAGHQIRNRGNTGVVILSQHADASYALALLRDGTGGMSYLLKERVGDRAELVQALRTTAAGGSIVDAKVVEQLVKRETRRTSSPVRRLNDRERDVLSGMARGQTNPGIAAELKLSTSAVEKHINAIFTKLDLPPNGEVHRRVAAVLAFLDATWP
jgi:DNA-binding NarL/FixJ family response regulator